MNNSPLPLPRPYDVVGAMGAMSENPAPNAGLRGNPGLPGGREIVSGSELAMPRCRPRLPRKTPPSPLHTWHGCPWC